VAAENPGTPTFTWDGSTMSARGAPARRWVRDRIPNTGSIRVVFGQKQVLVAETQFLLELLPNHLAIRHSRLLSRNADLANYLPDIDKAASVAAWICA
jgi:hypothetical protein